MTDRTLPADDPVFDSKMAAAYLGISTKTLERYRRTKNPDIPYSKFCGRNGPVRYRKSTLDAFLEATACGRLNGGRK